MKTRAAHCFGDYLTCVYWTRNCLFQYIHFLLISTGRQLLMNRFWTQEPEIVTYLKDLVELCS
ncbi:MAG: hypothetical protein AYK18_16615 [Theionarchaea archaeon DG-70]|nr:MAG: hypothetical protein AYK18_16615 [Theionarchaea archaeon DG-70]